MEENRPASRRERDRRYASPSRPCHISAPSEVTLSGWRCGAVRRARVRLRSDGLLELTDAGRGAAEQLAARREGLRGLLADWSPEQYAELGELLTRLSRAVLGADADWRLLSR
jgi:hypothetical protein